MVMKVKRSKNLKSKSKYGIKICNKEGCHLSTKYGSKKEAMTIIKKNKEADKIINEGGYRTKSTGKLIRINNKYKLMKIRTSKEK